MNIKDIEVNERPRERLISIGPKNISNEELVAIILKTGTKDQSVKLVASNLLKEFKLKDFKDLRLNSLKKIKGIGDVKAIELLASIELGRRIYENSSIPTKIKMNNAEIIYNYFKNIIHEKQEFFYVLFLDNKKNMITYKLIFKGTINASIIHPREIFKEAYLNSASSIICIHNHPSGDPIPSNEDITVTEKLVKIGELQGIKVVDHIIIGDKTYYSFFENNSLKI